MELGETQTYSPTDNERFAAMMAHLLQIVSGLWAPLSIYLVRRDSRFVAFHALQALLFQCVVFACMMLGLVIGIVGVVFQISRTPQHAEAFFPWAFLIFWGLIPLYWGLAILLSIIFGIKAHEGQWAKYPLVGNWALRIVK